MYWMNGNVKNIVISETQKLYFEAPKDMYNTKTE